jgi:Tol biopolymer transport system component
MTKQKNSGLSRRNMLSLGGGVALAPLAAGALPAGAAPAPASADNLKHVTVTEGTNVCPVVSPDGRQVAFDLYGVLWVVGVEGGPARRLTDEFGDVGLPDWSPDGKTIYFQSYRTGNFQIWSIGADGTGLKQLTDGPFDAREPRASPDGRRLAFSSDRGGSYGIHALDLASGAITTLVDTAAEEYEPSWSKDGGSIVFTVDRTKVDVVELASGRRRTVVQIAASSDPFSASELRSPAFDAQGKVIYTSIITGGSRLMRENLSLVDDEDVFPFRVSWLSPDEFVYASSGKIRRRLLAGGEGRPIEFSVTVPITIPSYQRRRHALEPTGPKPVVGIASPVLSPDGRSIAFCALNDIWIMRLGSRPEPLTRDSFYKTDPAWSPDGRFLSYSTDKGGKLDIWIRDLASGTDRQLTRLPNAAASGTWSADGKTIVFLDQTGAVSTVEVDGGAVRQIHGAMWEPGKPYFTVDGSTVILAAFKPYSARYREGLSQILTIDRSTGRALYEPVFPHKSFGTRGDDGPVPSPDGKSIAFVFGSLLYVAPIDAKGRLSGLPRKLNSEVSDCPSWSGDSKIIAYLSAGKLRLIPAAGGSPRSVPVPLTWSRPRRTERTLIRVGKLWDGAGPEVRRDVDILIEGARIAAVGPRGSLNAGNAKVVDATGLTAMPGLIDIHNHRMMQGYGYGDRQNRLWLSFGITTTRSPGDPCYKAVLEREAVDSGARIGPRFFTTGEAIDGSRIYYNFMRPVTEEGQLALELARADALGYDLLKSYVRAPLQQQKQVSDWGHAKGIPTTTHYHYPAALFGLDGMEHLGATSRFGYSRTVSPSGAGYEDVISLFAHSGVRRTPTIFTASTLLAEDPGLVSDPRVRALYPTWERAKLEGRLKAATDTPQDAARISLRNNVLQVRDMLRSGGKVVSGTDAPIDVPAVSLHLNLRAMVKYGVSPYEALLTATRYSGEFLNAPIGVLEVGAMADIALVEGDPLVRIEDAAEVRQVVSDGVVYTIDQLTAPFAATTTAEADHVHNPMLPPVPQHATSRSYWWHAAEYVESGRHACCSDVLVMKAFAPPAPKVRRPFRAEVV